jgi:hypothetical protein
VLPDVDVNSACTDWTGYAEIQPAKLLDFVWLTLKIKVQTDLAG